MIFPAVFEKAKCPYCGLDNKYLIADNIRHFDEIITCKHNEGLEWNWKKPHKICFREKDNKRCRKISLSEK